MSRRIIPPFKGKQIHSSVLRTIASAPLYLTYSVKRRIGLPCMKSCRRSSFSTVGGDRLSQSLRRTRIPWMSSLSTRREIGLMTSSLTPRPRRKSRRLANNSTRRRFRDVTCWHQRPESLVCVVAVFLPPLSPPYSKEGFCV